MESFESSKSISLENFPPFIFNEEVVCIPYTKEDIVKYGYESPLKRPSICITVQQENHEDRPGVYIKDTSEYVLSAFIKETISIEEGILRYPELFI